MCAMAGGASFCEWERAGTDALLVVLTGLAGVLAMAKHQGPAKLYPLYHHSER